MVTAIGEGEWVSKMDYGITHFASLSVDSALAPDFKAH
jgi:hypothetical protein